MNGLKISSFIGISIFVAAGLAACDKPGPAESAGRKIDQTAEEASHKLGDATAKAGEKLGEQGARAGLAIDDTEITAKVKAAILAEPGLKTLQISVVTDKGVVTLSGSVDSQPNSARAEGLASAVAGVKSVNNRLALK